MATAVGWIYTQFCTDINGPHKINPNDGDALTFPLAPPAGQYLFTELFQHLHCRLAQHFHGPRQCILMILVFP